MSNGIYSSTNNGFTSMFFQKFSFIVSLLANYHIPHKVTLLTVQLPFGPLVPCSVIHAGYNKDIIYEKPAFKSPEEITLHNLIYLAMKSKPRLVLLIFLFLVLIPIDISTRI